MKKLILFILIGALALILLAGAGVFFYIDSIAKAAIERGGTYALGVNTTVNSADVGVLSGEFSLAGLHVANPDGYDRKNFLALGDGEVAVTLGSLRKETVELPLFKLSDIDVSLERRNGKANFDVILDNLKRFESKDDAAKQEPSSNGKRFIVHEIDIRNIDVHIDMAPEVGDLVKITLPIQRVQLKDVGSDSDKGVLMGELIDIIVKAILQAAADVGAGLIPAELLNSLTSSLGDLESLSSMGVEFATQAGAEAEKLLQDITGEAEKALDDIGKEAEKAVDDVGKEIEKALDKLPFPK